MKTMILQKRHILLLFLSWSLSLMAEVISPKALPIDSAELAAEEEAEMAVMDELMQVADSINSEEGQPLVVIEQTELDRALLDWSLAWLDTMPCTAEPDTLPVADSVYRYRLSVLPNSIPMPYNDVVRGFIEMYVKRRPKQVAALSRLGEVYFPLFEDKLMQYSLPQELKYLAVIESALNASARSHAGAAGLWQFMPSTGRVYGLEVNSLVDERLDPYKSTDAACRYLKSLYRLFGDWHLALAAYNCGPGNVNKAINRSGGKKDFWSIYPWLPRETRAYVPIFIAANYALNYADVHGICRDTLWPELRLKQRGQMMPMVVDTIHSTKRQHLKQTADVLGLPIEELRRLNPQYLRDVLPGGKAYSLVLPMDYMNDYLQNEDTILAYKADSLLMKQQEVINMAQKTASDGTYSSGGILYYKVKKGDTLGAIAKRQHCTVNQLMRWNNLKNTNLQIGQKLKILR